MGEGQKKNIKINAVLPGAGTAMTATVMPKEAVGASKPENVAPLIGFLCSDAPEVPTGGVYESGCGFFAELQWRRSDGVFLDLKSGYGASDVQKNWGKITDMTNATLQTVSNNSSKCLLPSCK